MGLSGIAQAHFKLQGGEKKFALPPCHGLAPESGPGKKKEPAVKPGSVEDNHSSGTIVTDSLKRPTREPGRTPVRRPCGLCCSPIWSCSGWGLPCRGVLPPARCALTAPFHPYRPKPAVYFLWHFPWARAPQALPGTLSRRSPDFPPGPKAERLPGRLRGEP